MALAPRRRLLAVLFLALGMALGASLLQPAPAEAQVSGIKFPAPVGTRWEVLAGYNTVTHEGVDPYALDLWRVDGSTGGTALLAPISGEIGYSSDTCISIRTNEINLMMCHVFADSSLRRGDPVTVGQRIGTVAPDGQAANNGVAHIHFQLNARNDGPGSSGTSLPFAGSYAIEGVDLPAITTSNGYAGRAFVSSNVLGASVPPSVNAGPDRTVAPGEVVTLSAQAYGVTDVFWIQESGPSIATPVVQGSVMTFVAPTEPGAYLSFQVIGNLNGSLLTDSIGITVQAPPAEPAPVTPSATIVSGTVFHGGVSIIVFSGGTTEELVSAIGCPLPTLAMWASSPTGTLVQYTVGRPAFVNASWTGLFPAGLPELTPLLVKCS